MLRPANPCASSPPRALLRWSRWTTSRTSSRHAPTAPTSNPEALRAFATALDSPAAARPDFLAGAIRLDPDYGAPWIALANLYLARGDRTGAGELIARARHSKLDAFTSANLDLAAAELTQDRSLRIAALRHVASLTPSDTLLLRSLAEAETAAGQFDAAAADWKKLIEGSPNDASAWNSLGYARSWAGDYAGALAALREYQRLRPKDANPSDSIGDLNYSFRKFGEAAASYLEANNKQPAFEQFGALYKAAWAKFRAGDKPGADSLFAQFRTARAKTNPSGGIVELLTADWLYRTGRQPEAIAALRKLASEPAYAQLTIWDLLRGDREQAVRDAVAIGSKPAGPALFMVRFAAQPSAPASEWEARAARAFPPSASALRQLALGYALLLDGKREAARPVWEQIVNTNSATDFFFRATYARLQGKPVDRPLVPDPANLNQFAAIPDSI